MKKAIILLSAIMSVMSLTVMADEYIDPQTNVVYTYEPGQPTASVKAGYDEVISEGYGYELEVITHPGSPDAAGDVAILDKFTIGTAEYVVTSIGECAFWMNKNIKTVIIPETVTDIEAGAFKYCDSLTAVQLPDGLTQIADGLFYGCSQLVSVNIPSSVCSIGSYAFSQCSSLNNLTLPASLTFIGRFAFNDTPWYNALYNEAPDGPFYIGPQLVGYKGDAPTGELTIKDGTTCIGTEALRNCNRLTSVTIPESVAYIDYEAFYGCAGLTAVHITNMAAWCNIEFQEEFRSSSNPLFYAHHLFLNGEEVTDLVIPDGVTSIGRYAFDNCTALTSITISDGVTRVGSQAFRSCGNLTSVTIPPSVTTIESYAFIWCFNLNAVHISDLAAWCGNSFYHSCLFAYGAHFYLKGEEVKDLVIPEGVAGIGNGTFEDYSYLTSVTIPKSVTTIGENAFNGCKNLTDVYCHADSVPSTEAWVFYDTPIASATLHVPAGSIEKYKATSPWNGFGNIVALPDNPTESLCGEWWLVGWKDSGEWVEVDSKYVRHEHFTIVINEEGFVIAYSMVNEIFVGMLTLNGNEMFFEGGGEMTTALCDLEENLFFEDNICSIKRYTLEGNLLRLYYTDDDYFVFTKNLDSNEKHILAFTKEQMATIILPEEPDASKGKYYRLDRVEEGKIVFEQELHPQAHVPYVIVPNEDFNIDPNNMDLEGLSCDTASIGDVSFIGSYVSKELEQQEGCNIQLIDTTPDCSISFSEETGKRAFLVGALRAYLTWDDPYNQGGTKGRGDMEIVLRDYGTSLASPLGEKGEGVIYDLQGRLLPDKPSKGIYIEGGQKKIR